MTQLSFTPTAIEAGEAIQVSDSVQNRGATAATGVLVRVYLSDDASIEASDLMLGTRSVATLAPGAVSSGTRMLHVPVNTTPGTYFVGAVAGGAQEIQRAEDDDRSRLATGTLTVEPPVLPDLTCDTVIVSATLVNSGETIDVADTVRNRGIAAADSFQVAVFLSSDAVISTNDTLLGVRGVASLAPGAVSTVSGELTIPPTTVAGFYRVGVVADYLGAIVEVEELNNTALWSGTLQVLTPPRPDLHVDAVSFAPAHVDAGTTIDVAALVANLGVIDAPSSTLAMYLSDDATITRNDVVMGTQTIGALAPGGTATALAPVVVPADTEAGSYTVGAMADHADTVGESDESNNATGASGVLVVTVPPRPDIAVDFVTFSPTVVDSSLSEILRVEYSVTNVGVLPSAAFRAGVYLSSNTVVSTSDLVVGYRDFPGLAVGETAPDAREVALPGGVSAGSYYVGVIADDAAQVLETAEVNNIRFAATTLDVVASPAPLPNLVVSSVTFAPHQTLAGSTIQVQTEVRNIGNLSAGTFRIGVYLSSDESISADDLRLGERVVHHLGIQFGSASSAPYIVPGWVAPGTYFVGAVADEYGVIAESSEEDNVFKAAGSLVVLAAPPPGGAPALEPDRSVHSRGTVRECIDATPVDDELCCPGALRGAPVNGRGSWPAGHWITFRSRGRDGESLWLGHRFGARVDLHAPPAASVARLVRTGRRTLRCGEDGSSDK